MRGLFNLEADPGAYADRIDGSALREVQRELRVQLPAWYDQAWNPYWG